MSNISINREELERIIRSVKESENKKKICIITGIILAIAVIAAAAVLIYKKLNCYEEYDEFADDDFFDDFEDEMEDEAEEKGSVEDIFEEDWSYQNTFFQ